MANKFLTAAALTAFGFGTGAASAQDAEMVEAGEKVFKRCAACHQVGEDAKNRVGPVLTGLIGRKPAAVPDFNYSDAMIAFGEEHEVWDEDLLFTYLEDPRGMVKGTKMAFAGLRDEEDRLAVIEYIKANGGEAEPAS